MGKIKQAFWDSDTQSVKQWDTGQMTLPEKLMEQDRKIEMLERKINSLVADLMLLGGMSDDQYQKVLDLQSGKEDEK